MPSASYCPCPAAYGRGGYADYRTAAAPRAYRHQPRKSRHANASSKPQQYNLFTDIAKRAEGVAEDVAGTAARVGDWGAGAVGDVRGWGEQAGKDVAGFGEGVLSGAKQFGEGALDFVQNTLFPGIKNLGAGIWEWLVDLWMKIRWWVLLVAVLVLIGGIAGLIIKLKS